MKIVDVYSPGIAVVDGNGRLDQNPSMKLMAVLTEDEAGLFAVYIGLVPVAEGPQMYAESVARFGTKLRYEYIKFYFRGIEESRYRR